MLREKEEPSTSAEAGPPPEEGESCKKPRQLRKRASTSGSESDDETRRGPRGAGTSGRRRERSEREGPLGAVKEMFCSTFRVIVSQNRRRIKTDGFDLDLTYITDRIIAMGYPADATEALYRNSMKHIIRFLEKRHHDRYKVFNLRGQYSYDPANFKNRVISFEMTDHHPPRLELMAPFCREVHEWLCEDPRNVVAVHCKAGKGRTGVMICAYLSYCLFYPSPRQNMDYYSVVRTRNNKGVTIPSQRRYIYYYDHLRKHELNYFPLRVQLVGIYIERPPRSRGPIIKDELSVRVANGDVDVYYGDPMNISDETWQEEDVAWAGNVVSYGRDSYDPNLKELVEGCDVISRRAYGWTIPASKPVFLEGDVRVDLYVHKKFINIFTKTGRNKLGHIWFNTMFACPGACGGDPYVHGDEAHPYPDGETTIAERKNKKFLVGCEQIQDESCFMDESSDNQNTVVASSSSSIKKKSVAESLKSVTLSERLDSKKSVPGPSTSKSQPLLSPDKSSGTSTSIGGQSTINIGLSSKSRKSESRLSKAGKAAKKFFSTSEGAKARASEPVIGVGNPANSPHRRSNPEAMSTNTTPVRCPLKFEELQISTPPGLREHCSEESLKLIYRDKNKEPPRISIEKMLREAHEKDIVQDSYNERRRSVPHEGEPVKCAPDGRPTASGPNRIVRNCDEHVSVFPIMEIDRAFKNESINNGCKVYIVTKCIEPKSFRHGEAFMKVTYEKQLVVNEAIYQKSHSGKPYVDSAPKLSEYGAGKTWPPVIQYGNAGMQHGGEAATLTDDEYKNDPRARDERYCRYFYKQRRNSLSKYSSAGHVCPMTGQCIEGSMRSERLNTITTLASTTSHSGGAGQQQESAAGQRSVSPANVGGCLEDVGSENVGGSPESFTFLTHESAEEVAEGVDENLAEEEKLDLAVDADVRSYHPDPSAAWDGNSSRSSSSSEDIPHHPDSGKTTDMESSMTEAGKLPHDHGASSPTGNEPA